MKVKFKNSFEKDINKIKDRNLLAAIKMIIEQVETVSQMIEIKNIKKLQFDGNYYRIRVGDYRIGIALEQDTVIFIRVLQRKEIYRFFP